MALFYNNSMWESRKFYQRGSNSDNLFLVDRAIMGLTVKRYSMLFHWRADDGPTLNAGLVAMRFSRISGPT